jgi:hypothetical protein
LKSTPFENTKNSVFMKTKSSTSMGSLHPIIFFTVVYVVALLLSVFICSSLFYAFNGGNSKIGSEEFAPLENRSLPATTASTTVAMR